MKTTTKMCIIGLVLIGTLLVGSATTMAANTILPGSASGVDGNNFFRAEVSADGVVIIDLPELPDISGMIIQPDMLHE